MAGAALTWTSGQLSRALTQPAMAVDNEQRGATSPRRCRSSRDTGPVAG